MTPLDDDQSRLAQAVSALAKHRAWKRELAKSEATIRSGQCQGCDTFTSLRTDSDYCPRCHDEVDAPPEAIILVAPQPKPKATEARARKTFNDAVGIIVWWFLGMIGLAVVGWYAMRGLGWLCFKMGEML